MKLSDIPVNGGFVLNGQIGIVVEQVPKEPGGRITVVQYENGQRQSYRGHENPIVEYLGQGYLSIQFIMDNSK